MVIVELVLLKGTKRNLEEVPDGVRFVDVTLHVLKNMIYIYADNVLERLQILWDLKN
jgi:hypothetical protein|tara:strand:+ start:708 stop:878 length:171 start_codon:yes stop_codon:yes gene_type:complete